MTGTDAAGQLPARYLAQLLGWLESIGVERAPLLRAARIRRIDEPEARLSLAQVEALLAAATARSGRSDLGFELGLRLDATSHDMLGFALLTSPTFGQTLRLLASYQRLIQPFFALSVRPQAGRVELAYVPVAGLSPLSLRVLQEAIAVSNHCAFRAILHGGLSGHEIRLSIPRPPHAARYRELAGARVHFGEPVPGIRMLVDAALLERPLALANPRAMQAAEARCKAALSRAGGRRRWTDWCHMMLREAEDTMPTLEQLAGFVNVSPRTLARYLAAEGTGFRELALAVRTERAARLLSEEGLSVTQVAYRLGYGDVASFVRSFRGRTGRTPGSLRRGNKSDTPAGPPRW